MTQRAGSRYNKNDHGVDVDAIDILQKQSAQFGDTKPESIESMDPKLKTMCFKNPLDALKGLNLHARHK